MKSRWGAQSRWSILLLLNLFAKVSEASLAISYCSSDNNAGTNQPTWSEFQSTGLCGDRCQGAFAFAVLQGNNCWCSNYVPAEQEDTYSCNQGCPGIDTEWCGNSGKGLFAYFLLPAGNPLGTSGAGSSNTASSKSTSSSPVRTSAPSTVSPTLLSSTSIEAPSSVYTPPPSDSASSSAPPVSSSSSSLTLTPTSAPTEIYTSITTVTGRVQTVVITPSASPTADATLGQSSTTSGHGVSTGKVVGIVLGVALGIGLIIGGSFWFCFRRKRRHENLEMSQEGSFVAERVGGSGSGINSVPSRQVSQMSTSGLLGKAPRIITNGLAGGGDLRSAGAQSSNVDRRSLGTDQRLNPWALYSQEDQHSSVSLQDNQDYSRQLRVANPDV